MKKLFVVIAAVAATAVASVSASAGNRLTEKGAMSVSDVAKSEAIVVIPKKGPVIIVAEPGDVIIVVPSDGEK